MKILFWGTPAFALPALRAILGEGHDVVGVVTQPDRPAGRGRELASPPVKKLAMEEGLPVLQPERPVGEPFLDELRKLGPDVSVVIAYGQILREEVLTLPPRGSINLHASLLPALRGAAPIQYAIANGDERTGVTVMRMVAKMDAGPILLQVAEPIAPDETATDLTARLSEIGAEALVEALALLEAGVLTEIPQDDAFATFAPRIRREDARVDWSRPAHEIACRIRAFDAVPGAWTTLDGVDLKVFRPLAVDDDGPGVTRPGTVLDVSESDVSEGMRVACGTGTISIREVQPMGRRRMTTAQWVRGRGIGPGARLV